MKVLPVLYGFLFLLFPVVAVLGTSWAGLACRQCAAWWAALHVMPAVPLHALLASAGAE